MKYICENCGEVFDEDDLVTISEHTEHFGCPCCYEETDMSCCYCGGNLVEATKCPVCDEYMSDDKQICDDCYNSVLADEDKAIETARYVNQEKETVEINSFLWYHFSKDEIEEILWNSFLEEQNKLKSIQQYYDDNIETLVDTLQ
jgi:hypothetical protein